MKKHQNWTRILPGLLVSVMALAVVFYFADLESVFEALRLADLRLLLLLCFTTFLWILIRSVVWRILLQEEATLGQVFLTVNEGYLVNNVLPLRLGEIARSFFLSRKTDMSFWQVFSTIIIERIMDLMMATGILLSTLPFVVGADWARQAGLIAGGLVLLGLAALYLLARNQAWAMRQFERLGARYKKVGQSLGKTLETFFNGLSVLTDSRRFLKALIWIIINWSVALLQYYIVLRAFFPGEIQWLWAAFTLGVVALGAAAPSSPGAVGVLEASMVGALSVFGLDPSIALAAALAAHAANYLITGVLGGYALVQDGIQLTRVGQLYNQLQTITPESDSLEETESID